MKRTVKIISLVLLLAASGCARRYVYTEPGNYPPPQNSVEIARSKEVVWMAIIPGLGKHFFMINNIDKASGLINLSFSADPAKYVDCGTIHSYVLNAAGERSYTFPAASAFKNFEVWNENGLFVVKRKMGLEGRINLIVEELGPTRTRITINTRYAMNKSTSSLRLGVDSWPNTETDSIGFTSGETARFASTTICRATGKLEEEMLAIIAAVLH